MTMPELLLPAGNLKKLKTAFHFGADAVYLGGKNLSLRAFADNFSYDDIAAGISYAHSIGKKVYVAANIFASNADIKYAEEYFDFLASAKADALLISDPGLIRIAKKYPLTIHLSTQANTSNSEAVRFWQDVGVKRVVLARELSLDEVAKIHSDVPDMELEVFVHGAMCMAISGRCMLSAYFTSRSANKGECAQPCRWGYRLQQTDRHSHLPLDIEEDGRNMYLLNSKDLCLIDRIPELIGAGVASMKVEGRMKSEFYVATVTNAYRQALDEYAKFGGIPNIKKYKDSLESVSHRPYTEAFFDGYNPDTFSSDAIKTEESHIFVASVLDYSNGIATVEMRNRFRSKDVLYVLSPSSINGESFVVDDITEDGVPTDDAKLVQHVYSFPCPLPLAKDDILTIKRM